MNTFHAPELQAVIASRREPASIGVSLTDIDNFFMCLALCHTVVPERDTPTGPIVYQAESPDEGALVSVRPCCLRQRVILLFPGAPIAPTPGSFSACLACLVPIRPLRTLVIGSFTAPTTTKPLL